MRARLVLSPSLLLLGLAACGPAPRYFFDNAYYATPHSVRLRYIPAVAEHHGLMSGEWRIANWWGNAYGEPMVLKSEELHVWALDRDRDGTTDVRGEEPRDDIRFLHCIDGSEIWLRGIPLGDRGAAARLDALAAFYLSRIRANDDPHVDLDWPPARPQAVVLDAEGPVTVAGQPGWEVRAHAGPHRFALVFFRPGTHDWRASGPPREAWATGFPILLVAGYVTPADDGAYDAHRADFDSFLSRIDVAPERPAGR